MTGVAFALAAFGVLIEGLGLGAYLLLFPFPRIGHTIASTEWLELLSFAFGIFWWIAALPAVLVLLLAAAIELSSERGRRRRWVALALAHGSMVVGFLVLDRLDNPDRAVRRSEAVVDAIRKYEADQGAPPPDLESLVPAYLDALPNTWCPSYRGWKYEALAAAPPSRDRTWELSIECRKEFFEDLRYAPEPFEDVSQYRRIGQWVYWRD